MPRSEDFVEQIQNVLAQGDSGKESSYLNRRIAEIVARYTVTFPNSTPLMALYFTGKVKLSESDRATFGHVMQEVPQEDLTDVRAALDIWRELVDIELPKAFPDQSRTIVNGKIGRMVSTLNFIAQETGIETVGQLRQATPQVLDPNTLRRARNVGPLAMAFALAAFPPVT